MQRTSQDRIQSFIFTLEHGVGATILKLASLFLGFVLLAIYYNASSYHASVGQEAMENAHLARQLSEGRGYVTESIRPLALGLLERADTNNAANVLNRPVPDLSVAPGYPFILSCAMRVLPFHFKADPKQPWSYQPEILITAFNQFLLFLAVLLTFLVARKMFDATVAWLAVFLFCGTEIYWKFSVSGLSTIWVMLVFLALVWTLLKWEEQERDANLPGAGRSLAWALAAGALVGLGGLSRYSFAWLIVPVLLFLARYSRRGAGKILLGASVAFLVVLGPWITRNVALSATPFGTATYAALEGATPPLQQDLLERSFHPNHRLNSATWPDVKNKFLFNEEKILRQGLPQLGSSWVAAFFFCGLLLSFRSPALQRIRLFLLGCLLLFLIVQPLGQTHLSADQPELSSENLLVILSPLVLIFGLGFFFTLLDQMTLPEPRMRGGVIVLFGAVACAPLFFAISSYSIDSEYSPYAPWHVQRTASMMQPDELTMSDIPWAVAWYGDRPCVWLTDDDADSYAELNRLKAVQAIYLTQRTSDSAFFSQMIVNQQSWSSFMLNALPESAWPQGEVPNGFALKNAALDYLPGQLFLSDHVRWKSGSKP